jgi:diaminohydroxyphosphoribosylaminopyrimidine deaminase/5-amino-6-(5-phosphoribosylamino)uracil reductase
MTDYPTETDLRWLRRAIELSRRCTPTQTAFSVGALIVDAGGRLISEGWSRRNDPYEHAEEAALAAAGNDQRLSGATMYSSLEPCSVRASRPRTCTELILAAGLPRVVFAWREPTLFVNCEGAELLRAAGVSVQEVPALAGLVRDVNAHLVSRYPG